MSRNLDLFIYDNDFPEKEWGELLELFDAIHVPPDPDELEEFPYVVDEWVVTTGETTCRVHLQRRHERLSQMGAGDWFWRVVLDFQSGFGAWAAFTFAATALSLFPGARVLNPQCDPPHFYLSSEQLLDEEKMTFKPRILNRLGLPHDDGILAFDPTLIGKIRSGQGRRT